MKIALARGGWIRWAGPMAVAAMVAAGVGRYTTATPAVASAPQPVTIAVVDMVKLTSGLTKAGVLDAQRRARGVERQKSLDEMASQIEQMKSEMKLLPKTAEKEQRELYVKITELEQTTKARLDALQRVTNFENGDIMRELYMDTQKAAAAYAQKNGIDMVLLDDRAMEVPERATADQMNMVIQNKRILYAGAALDITAALTQEMNNEYQAPPAAPSESTSAPK